MNRIVVAALAVFATAIVLAAGAQSSPSTLEMRAFRALATARPAAAAVAAVPTASVAPLQHKPKPAPITQTASAPAADDAPAVTEAAAPAAAEAATNATPTATATGTPTATPTPKASKAKHVFVIAVHGAGYQQTFGPDSPATYLNKTLRPQGALLAGFTPLGTADLPNYLAFASGQPPNADTSGECTTFKDFPSSATADAKGIVKGDGCVYPNTIITLGDQVSSSGGYWRAYAEGLDDGTTTDCRHPGDGAADDTATATSGYATRHVPFVYFHSLLDLGDCISSVKDLTAMPKELKTIKPALTYIAPDLCDDGTVPTCGLAKTDAFLQEWVPKIQSSAIYKRDGVLVIAFLSGSDQPTGALVLSKFARKGSLYAKPYDPYGLLHSVESLLGLEPLAKAATAPSFAKLVLPGAF